MKRKNPYNIWNNFFVDFFRNLAETNRKCVNEVCDYNPEDVNKKNINILKERVDNLEKRMSDAGL